MWSQSRETAQLTVYKLSMRYIGDGREFQSIFAKASAVCGNIVNCIVYDMKFFDPIVSRIIFPMYLYIGAKVMFLRK